MQSMFSDHNIIKLEIKNRKVTLNSPNTQKQNNTSKCGSKRKSQGKSKHTFELNENENTTYPKLWNIAKAMLRGKFVALNSYMKNRKSLKSKILKNIVKEEQNKSKASIKEEAIKKLK